MPYGWGSSSLGLVAVAFVVYRQTAAVHRAEPGHAAG